MYYKLSDDYISTIHSIFILYYVQALLTKYVPKKEANIVRIKFIRTLTMSNWIL